MREYKSRRFIKTEQLFLVFEDQVVCRNVVRDVGATFKGTVDSMPLLVDGKIPIMDLCCVKAVQIFLIFSVEQVAVFVTVVIVFFFEYLLVFALDFVAFVIVRLVFGNFVNEEQRKRLDAAFEIELFLFEVRLDGFADLGAFHGVFGNVADHLALA